MVDSVSEKINQKIDMNLFNNDLLDTIRDVLLEKQETVSVAESVTSGFIQLALSQPSNATKFFEGGITVYNVGQKAKHLHVPPIIALDCDSVSEEVSAKMALSACNYFMSDYGLAITGYATLVPKREINTLFAYISIVHKDKVIYSEKIEPKENIEGLECQLFYTQKILDLFLEQLKKK